MSEVGRARNKGSVFLGRVVLANYNLCIVHTTVLPPSDLLEHYRSNFLGRRICLPVRVVMVTGGVGGVGVAGVVEVVVGVIGRAVEVVVSEL